MPHYYEDKLLYESVENMQPARQPSFAGSAVFHQK